MKELINWELDTSGWCIFTYIVALFCGLTQIQAIIICATIMCVIGGLIVSSHTGFTAILIANVTINTIAAVSGAASDLTHNLIAISFMVVCTAVAFIVANFICFVNKQLQYWPVALSLMLQQLVVGGALKHIT